MFTIQRTQRTATKKPKQQKVNTVGNHQYMDN